MKILRRLLAVLVICGVALWLLGPYEDATLTLEFDATALEGGVASYLSTQEARFDDIVEGVQKRVIWAGAEETRTEWAVLYIHGFSATSEEIRPVPDEVAKALGANLVFTRLAGHGRGSAPMGEATVQAWMSDTAEAFAAAQAVGEKVLVISTSTGGTLVTAALAQGAEATAAVFVSPNFGVNNPAAPLLTWPAVRYWLPPILGRDYSFEARSPEQAKYWTTAYPSVAVLPMAALVKAVNNLDLGAVATPALFVYTREDQVVVPEATDAIVARWGGATKVNHPTMGPMDDPFHHVIAGAIQSPTQTEGTVAQIIDFIRGL